MNPDDVGKIQEYHNPMTLLDRLKESSVWDKTYDLPTIPGENNPFFYLALITKLYRGLSSDEMGFSGKMFHGSFEYMRKCMKDRGLYHRRPDGSGGVTSHDELIGIAYLDFNAAADINGYLQMKDGVYNNTGEDDSERYNLHRFPWFMSYIQARANFRVGLKSQFWYALHIFIDARDKTEDHPDGKLMNWLMNEEMKKYWLCGVAINYWNRRMRTVDWHGMAVAKWFTCALPKHPILAQLAVGVRL